MNGESSGSDKHAGACVICGAPYTGPLGLGPCENGHSAMEEAAEADAQVQRDKRERLLLTSLRSPSLATTHADGVAMRDAADYIEQLERELAERTEEYEETRELLGKELERKARWMKLADERAIEVADLKVQLARPSAASRSEDRLAEDAIDLFLEYRDKHGHNEQAAKAAALNEFAEARSPEVQASPSSAVPLVEKIEELQRAVPPEEWDKLPRTGVSHATTIDAKLLDALRWDAVRYEEIVYILMNGGAISFHRARLEWVILRPDGGRSSVSGSLSTILDDGIRAGGNAPPSATRGSDG